MISISCRVACISSCDLSGFRSCLYFLEALNIAQARRNGVRKSTGVEPRPLFPISQMNTEFGWTDPQTHAILTHYSSISLFLCRFLIKLPCVCVRSLAFIMSPIERMNQRAQAFSVLGLSPAATLSDIRNAFRKLAFETHPDKNPDAGVEFEKISSAYRYLNDNADGLKIPPGEGRARPARPQTTGRTVSRPTIKANETDFDETTRRECQDMLDQVGGEGKKHVASSLYRIGRHLTYAIEGAAEKGRNEVAIPTGFLEDSRKVMPRVIAFLSKEMKGNSFELLPETCAEHFPGARSITLKFPDM